jgi:hypothetical protein
MTDGEQAICHLLEQVLAELKRQHEPPMMLTRTQAAERAQVSLNKLDDWSFMPGFPIVREDHFVRIHTARLDDWLAELASMTNRPMPIYPPEPRRTRARKQA